MTQTPERTDQTVLICDLVGLRLGADGKPDCSELRAHVQAAGAVFHEGGSARDTVADDGRVHFFYRPELNSGPELMAEAGDGAYDAVIAAATVIPEGTVFRGGGVRIGAGTGNMQSASWGGATGAGGIAPLMNTPGINSRATAHMVMKAILRALPGLPFDTLHDQCVEGSFDTGRDLWRFPAEKIEGKRIAVLGYGNIGREVARLAAAFGMTPVVYARARHRHWIEAEGYIYAATPLEAAAGADIVSVHLGLGPADPETGGFANEGLVGADLFAALASGAMLVNFDRGEVVQASALEQALATGQIRHAAIDADIFVDPASGAASGPLVPYLDLAKRYSGRVLVLPHAVADTDHPSRVAGAKQAVDQILGALRDRRVAHVKGSVPSGYTAVAGQSVTGIGSVSARDLVGLADHPAALADMVAAAGRLHAFLSQLEQEQGRQARTQFCKIGGAQAMQDMNTLAARLRAFGLHGPFDDDEAG